MKLYLLFTAFRMNNFKYINVDNIKEYSDGSTDLIKELVELFIQQVPVFYSQMVNYHNLGEYELLGKLAHKIKNSVAMMGIAELTSSMGSLELLAQNKSEVESYADLIKCFNDISTQAIDELKFFVSTL